MTMTPIDLEHLRMAIALSSEASARGDEPYAAVLADGSGRVLATALNTQHSERDCTGHAETNLLRDASRRSDRETLSQCTVYANGEPCAMCAGAIYWSNVPRVVYALPVATMKAAAGAEADELLIGCREVLARGMHAVEVLGPALEDEARAVLEAHHGRR